MLVLLILHLLAALIAPTLIRWQGPRACYLLALVPATAFGWALALTPAVRAGRPVVEFHPWVPALRLDLAFRLTTLSWLMALLVGGIGALVLIYCAGYFSPPDPGLGRLAGLLMAFAGAMIGLVLADNLLLLYVCWELTTVFSYLLIGHDGRRRPSRSGAAQALIVTALGGLAMLIGFVIIGEQAGTYRWSEIAAAPGRSYPALAVLLVLAGALAKSAVFPFSVWLPAAMTAPTPVSAYLHAAAMVKAGVYLIGLLSPVLADTPPWRPVTLLAGLATLLAGGWAALRQVDLKLLLAFGTVSQLGLLVVVAGAGTAEAALAMLALLTAHALFKAALFLTVGIVEHATGTRDLRRLTGLRARLPAVWAVTVLAAASMAGVPPLFGFVAKEAALHAVGTEPLVLGAVVVGSALTVAYSVRLLWGLFGQRPTLPPPPVGRPGRALLVPPAVLAVVGLLLGPFATSVGAVLRPYGEQFPGADHQLALWSGPTPELGLSLVVLVAGALVAWRGQRLAPALAWLRAPVPGPQVFQRVTTGVDRIAVEATRRLQRGSLPQYLGTILVAVVALPGAGLVLAADRWPAGAHLWDTPVQLLVCLLLVVAAVLAVVARRRFTAMLLVGVTGYATAMIFMLRGAPDLALTQVLVETATIVLLVLGLRRLPPWFTVRPRRGSRVVRAAVGVAVGAVLAGLAAVAAGARGETPISVEFPRLAVAEAYGSNVVNVILVDFRAWDTLGEMAVLVVAATGVTSLVFQRARTGPRPRRRAAPVTSPRGRRVWLRGGLTLRERRRSLVFEVVARLLFHTIVLFSVFLLVAGHHAPGGGFAGGLVAGLALALRYLAGGRYELAEAAPVNAGTVLGSGLALMVGSGVASSLAGGRLLESARLGLSLPLLGDVHMVTSFVFDVGVYLVVVGLALDVLRSLGAEVDRQIQASGEPGWALATDRGEEWP